MSDLLRFSLNIFGSKEISDLKLRKFTENHLRRLQKNNPCGIYNSQIIELISIYTEFFGEFEDENTRETLINGATSALETDMNAFKETVIKKEIIIRRIFGSDNPIYQEFYPYGIDEYKNATLENIEMLMTRITDTAKKYETNIGLKLTSQFINLKNEFDSTRATQFILINVITGRKNASIKSRKIIETQLIKNLLIIALNNIDNPDAVNIYFDRVFINKRNGKNYNNETADSMKEKNTDINYGNKKNDVKSEFSQEDKEKINIPPTEDLQDNLKITKDSSGDATAGILNIT